MRVLAPRALGHLRALQNGNMPFVADILGNSSTGAGPKGQPIAGEIEIALAVPCRVSAADPDETTRALAGQQTTLDVMKVIFPLNTPVKKQYKLRITDSARTYSANIISVKSRTANSTAEIVYAQEI